MVRKRYWISLLVFFVVFSCASHCLAVTTPNVNTPMKKTADNPSSIIQPDKGPLGPVKNMIPETGQYRSSQLAAVQQPQNYQKITNGLEKSQPNQSASILYDKMGK